MDVLWDRRQRESDLVGTVINIHNGEWVRRGECLWICLWTFELCMQGIIKFQYYIPT